MNQQLKSELLATITNDEWMIGILKTVRNLNLNDCWIGAGFVRNKIWDVKHGKERTALNDIDVIYFDALSTTKTQDLQIENTLQTLNPALNWSVKNQARMHLRNGHKPYKDCNTAISFWPETATSIAVRINLENQIECLAPHGLEDLFNLVVVPTPQFNLSIYARRIQKKNWNKKWNQLTIKME